MARKAFKLSLGNRAAHTWYDIIENFKLLLLLLISVRENTDLLFIYITVANQNWCMCKCEFRTNTWYHWGSCNQLAWTIASVTYISKSIESATDNEINILSKFLRFLFSLWFVVSRIRTIMTTKLPNRPRNPNEGNMTDSIQNLTESSVWCHSVIGS